MEHNNLALVIRVQWSLTGVTLFTYANTIAVFSIYNTPVLNYETICILMGNWNVLKQKAEGKYLLSIQSLPLKLRNNNKKEINPAVDVYGMCVTISACWLHLSLISWGLLIGRKIARTATPLLFITLTQLKTPFGCFLIIQNWAKICQNCTKEMSEEQKVVLR